MKYLIFDTETTGLPLTRNTTSGKWYKKYPHIVQISWIMYDSDKNQCIDIQDFIVKIPDDVEISEKSTSIHGISKEISQKKGTTIEDILPLFSIMLNHCDMIIGHNIEFDINMIRAEFLRNNYIDPFILEKHKQVYCTMKHSIELCKIEALSRYGNTYYKWPKLIELHNFLFHTTPKNLHNSLTDIYVTLRCFYKMLFDIDLYKTNNTFYNNTKQIFE